MYADKKGSSAQSLIPDLRTLHGTKRLNPVAPKHCLWWRLTKSLCSVSSDIAPSPRPPATVTWESTEPSITGRGERLLRGELALEVLTTDHSKPEFIVQGIAVEVRMSFITISAAIYITQERGFFPHLTLCWMPANSPSRAVAAKPNKPYFFPNLSAPF